MIAYIDGRVVEQTENACIVATGGGVGYEVFLPGHSLSRLPGTGETVHFFICTVVREDALELYGFDTWDERQTFILLTSINRVGARTAMAVLSVFRPDDLRRMVVEDDVLSLTRVPGIGKKSAQQIFLELKYKLKGDGTAAIGPSSRITPPGGIMGDTVMGLTNLGYEQDEALRIVKQVLENEPDLDVSGALRAALKLLAKAR